MTSFTDIPVLSLAEARVPDSKASFLADLRSALLNVGFLYLKETSLPNELVSRVITECRDFFEKLPEEEKLHIEMKNEKSFLGYSRVRGLTRIIIYHHITVTDDESSTARKRDYSRISRLARANRSINATSSA